jgi:hypothetical protein
MFRRNIRPPFLAYMSCTFSNLVTTVVVRPLHGACLILPFVHSCSFTPLLTHTHTAVGMAQPRCSWAFCPLIAAAVGVTPGPTAPDVVSALGVDLYSTIVCLLRTLASQSLPAATDFSTEAYSTSLLQSRTGFGSLFKLQPLAHHTPQTLPWPLLVLLPAARPSRCPAHAAFVRETLSLLTTAARFTSLLRLTRMLAWLIFARSPVARSFSASLVLPWPLLTTLLRPYTHRHCRRKLRNPFPLRLAQLFASDRVAEA